MAKRQSKGAAAQSEDRSWSLTLSEANARAWIVSTLVRDLRGTDPHPKCALCAQRLLMVETAMDGCQTQLDELDESDAALVARAAREASATFDSSSKVLISIDDETSLAGLNWSSSQLALLQASYTLCRDMARMLDELQPPA